MTRGDVRIIDGKLCYAFDVSDTWVSKLNGQTRFYKSGDEWKVKSVEVENGVPVAWCYLINPFNTSDKNIKRLELKLRDLEKYIDQEVERQERVEREIKEWNNMPFLTKIKIRINRLFHREIFNVPFCYRFSWIY